MNEDRKPPKLVCGAGVKAEVHISGENAERLEAHYGEDLIGLRRGLRNRLELAAHRFQNDVESVTREFSAELEYSLAQDGFDPGGPVLVCRQSSHGPTD